MKDYTQGIIGRFGRGGGGMSDQEAALTDVLAERKRQDEKWGEQNHNIATWLEILHEETGEVAKADLEHRFSGKDSIYIRDEVVQVAAVALAIVECIDRQTIDAIKRRQDAE